MKMIEGKRPESGLMWVSTVLIVPGILWIVAVCGLLGGRKEMLKAWWWLFGEREEDGGRRTEDGGQTKERCGRMWDGGHECRREKGHAGRCVCGIEVGGRPCGVVCDVDWCAALAAPERGRG